MIYQDAVDNLRMLMRSCIVLSREEMHRFFSSDCSAAQVDYFIDAMIRERVLDADESDSNIIWLRRQARPISRYGKKYVKDRIKAFWVIANVGCDGIMDVAPLEPPSQFLFITSDNTLYDVTICDTIEAAKVAVFKRNASIKREFRVDEINHIALVENESMGEAIKQECLNESSNLFGGFDCYCILDNDNIPRYTSW